MEFKDWAVVFATCLSPLIAIQVSLWIFQSDLQRLLDMKQLNGN